MTAVKEADLARERGIGVLKAGDPAYPALLKTIHEPPPVLYCKGDPGLFERPAIALVGSRRPTLYGEKMAQVLARELCGLGIVVVSGLARGIDTAAHRGALEAKGKTIAVLGSGLLNVYPPENKRLADSIGAEGLLLSEFPLSAEPEAWHFPQRNRLIAGLSMGTVVIEAAEASGALITARLAAEQGREVFAVPGPVTSKMSAGPHRLIKEGAKLVEKVEDILEEIGPLKDLILRQKKSAPAAGLELSAQESAILGLLDREPLPIDVLSSRSGLKAGEFSHSLLSLELKGAVRSLPGKIYARN